MPTVPTQFVPQIGSAGIGSIAPFQATPGQPAQNVAAEQAVAAGTAAVHLGDVEYRLGRSMQDAVDEAAAKGKVAQFLQTSQQALYGENGYLTTSGKTAHDQFNPAQNALLTKANELMDLLDNDSQKRLFGMAVDAHMTTFSGRMLEHRSRETKTFYMNEANAYTDRLINEAAENWQSRNQAVQATDASGKPTLIPDGPYHAASTAAVHQAEQIGRLMGYPENSEQMQRLRTNVNSQIVTGAVQRMMAENQFSSAMAFVEDQRNKRALDEKAATHLTATVSASYERQVAREAAERIISDGIAEAPSYGNFVMPVDGASTNYIHDTRGRMWETKTLSVSGAPQSPIVAPMDAVVEFVGTAKFKGTDNKIKEGKQIVLRFEDGTRATMNDVGDTEAVYAGQHVGRGQKISSLGAAPMLYSVQKEGTYIDPANLNVLNPTIDRSMANPPATLREALYIANGAPERFRPMIRDEVKSRWNENAALAAHEMDAANQMAVRLLATPVVDPTTKAVRAKRVTELPEPLLRTLSAQQVSTLSKMQLEKDDDMIRFQLAMNPSIATRDWLVSNQDRMTPATFTHWMDKSDQMRQQATAEAELYKQVLVENGQQGLAYPKANDEDAVARALQFRSDVDARITAAQAAKKQPLEPSEQRAIILDCIKARQINNGWWGNNFIPSASATTAEIATDYVNYKPQTKGIPEEEVKAIVSQVRSAMGITPTADMVAQIYNDKHRKKGAK